MMLIIQPFKLLMLPQAQLVHSVHMLINIPNLLCLLCIVCDLNS